MTDGTFIKLLLIFTLGCYHHYGDQNWNLESCLLLIERPDISRMDIKFQVTKMIDRGGDVDDWLEFITELKRNHTDRDLLLQIHSQVKLYYGCTPNAISTQSVCKELNSF